MDGLGWMEISVRTDSMSTFGAKKMQMNPISLESSQAVNQNQTFSA